MPSTSQKQARFMAAAAHDPEFAKRVGISQKVAREFNQADKGSSMLHRAMMGKHTPQRKKTPLERVMER